MAPKKKKTKEEIEAEKAKLAEEARLAEEERLRQEEEARKVAEQSELRRQQLLAEFRDAQDARLQQQRDDLVPLIHQLQQERAVAEQQQADADSWLRYLACTSLPDPRLRPDVNDFLSSLLEGSNDNLDLTMKQCEDCVQVANHCMLLAAEETLTASSAAAAAVLAAGRASGGDSPDLRVSELEPAAAAAAATAPAPPAAEGEEVQEAGITEHSGNSSSSNTSSSAATAAMLLANANAAAVAADARAAQYREDAQQLYQHIKRKMDMATASVLHCADEYADDKGDVLLTAQQGPLQWGLWVNTHKNPRFKLIDFGGLGMTVEIPKQLALASVALRVQRRPYCECTSSTTTSSSSSNGSSSARAASDQGSHSAAHSSQQACLAPLGGVLHVDLLSLSAPARQCHDWNVRQLLQVTSLASNVAVVPYPIPPAGADLASWQPDEEPPPLTFSMQLSPQLLVPSSVRVGWWDSKQAAWSEEGVSGVSFDALSGRLTFSSVHLGCLALLQDTAAAVPYSSWTIRPTAGLGGGKAIITIHVQAFSSSSSSSGASSDIALDASNSSNKFSSGADVVLEVGSNTVTLLAPALPQMSHLLGQPMQLWQLLRACCECGLQLTPGSRDARVAGLQEKDQLMEGAMCADLALLCGNFLVASSRWNRAAGAGAALVRLSEVTDWEEGGRTSAEHAARIFKREVPEGDRRVLVARRQGLQGVMWVDGGDNRMEPPLLPDFSTVEGVQAAARQPHAHLNASLLHALAGPHAEVAGQPGAQALAASGLGLQQARAIDPVFSSTMQRTLQALRLFTFS